MRNIRIVLSLAIAVLAATAQAQLPVQLTAADIKAGNAARAAVSILSVGTGQCVAISCPNGATILNDCGHKTTTMDAGLAASAKNFFSQIVPAGGDLYVVVSHPDDDHYSLIPDFVNNTNATVKGIVLGGKRTDYTDAAFKQWLAGAEQRKVPITTYDIPSDHHNAEGRPEAGLPCGSVAGDGMYILTANVGVSKNDKSVMTAMRHGAFSSVMMGDAESETTEKALSYYPTANSTFLNTTLLVSAHHGSNTNGSNSPEWAAATVPNVVAFSAGQYYLNYGHPRCDVAAAYAAASGGRFATVAAHDFSCYDKAKTQPRLEPLTAPLYNTRDLGAVVVLSEGNSWRLWTCANNSVTACQRAVN